MSKPFDDQRLLALLDLAGPAHALELATRLDEDLTGVAVALTAADKQADQCALRAQSHVLLGIAGTVGASQLFELSRRLNALVRGGDTGACPDILAQVMVLLHQLIGHVRTLRSALLPRP